MIAYSPNPFPRLNVDQLSKNSMCTQMNQFFLWCWQFGGLSERLFPYRYRHWGIQTLSPVNSIYKAVGRNATQIFFLPVEEGRWFYEVTIHPKSDMPDIFFVGWTYSNAYSRGDVCNFLHYEFNHRFRKHRTT